MTPVVYFFFLTFLTNPETQTVFQVLRFMETTNVCPATTHTCENCQELITTLQQELSDPIVQDDIIKFLEFMCHTQQPQLAELCLETVHELVPVLIDELLSLDPYTTCRDLWLC